MESEYITPIELGVHFKSKRLNYRFLTVDLWVWLNTHLYKSSSYQDINTAV